MRKLYFVAVLTALAFGGAASASTVQLRWTGASAPGVVGLGTSVADVSGVVGPVHLTLDILVGADAAGISAGGVDLEFDTDLLNELDLVSFTELTWGNAKATRTLTQLSPGIARTLESDSNHEGQAFGFEAFTLGTGASNVTFTFARLVFSTSALRAFNDGNDIFSTNERDPLATAFFDNGGLQVQIPTLGAAVNGLAIPEPGTFGLLGLGLVSLAAASRRRA